MAFNNPSVADFKQQFVRDFPYGTDMNTSVLDADIGNAFNFVNINFNPANWDNQTSYSLGYNLLAAHFLVLNLRAGSQGINGQYNWIQNSKAVQGVSEAFTIPQQIQDNPFFTMLTKTNYGAQYLQILLPQLIGAMYTVCGTTLP